MERVLIQQVLENPELIEVPDKEVEKRVKENWDFVAKPIDSMGYFEELFCRIGAIHNSEVPTVERAKLLVFCADNGVVAEGVSQSDQSITRICADNISRGISSVGVMAKQYGIQLEAIDIGMNTKESYPYVRDCKVMEGTRDFYVEPAMSREECLRAIQVGMDLVKEEVEKGTHIVATGEMGIGNTTTSSAIASALLHLPAETVTGRGAGLDDDALRHKTEIIKEAVKKYELQEADPLVVLQTVGGLDIAGMVGACIGGAVYHMPIVLDGVISIVAALVACRICPMVRKYLISSHCSKEPAAKRIGQELKLRPVIDADMALGEGTGAVLMIGLLKAAGEVYKNSTSFQNAGIEQYKRFQ